jgi:2-oxoglutarate ferredoxin oxidoreductase subunit delta
MCIPACPFGVKDISKSLIHFPMKTLNKAGYFVAEPNDPDGKCTACMNCAMACPDCAIVVYKAKKEPVAGGAK